MLIQTTRIYTEIQQAVDKGYTLISEQGSSRSSKTYNTLIWLLAYCLQHPNICLSIVRKTLPAIKGSVFRDFKEILTNMGVYTDKSLNRTEMIYTLPNRTIIEFFSTDNEQKLRGRKRDILYVNEANELSELEWQQLKMRTTKFTIIDYNPSFTDEHWICALNKDPRTYHFISTYKDNPFLEQAIIDEIESLRHKNKSLWQVYGLGQMAIIEGLIFPDIEIGDEIPDHATTRWYGVDYGYTNDPTAIVEVARAGDTLYIDEIAYQTEMLTSDIIRVMKSTIPEGGKIWSESADPRLVTEIHRAGLNIRAVKKYKGSIEAGLNKMKEFRICVTRRSTNVIKEYKNYTYAQDREGKWLNQPIDCYNHAIDAIRYVVLSEILAKDARKKASKYF